MSYPSQCMSHCLVGTEVTNLSFKTKGVIKEIDKYLYSYKLLLSHYIKELDKYLYNYKLLLSHYIKSEKKCSM